MFKFFSTLFTDLVGSRNKRLLKTYQKLVVATNAFEAGLKELSDEALKAAQSELGTARARLREVEAELAHRDTRSAEIREQQVEAVRRWAADVRDKTFPSIEETYARARVR